MKNHGISDSVTNGALEMAKEFFNLPAETKMEVRSCCAVVCRIEVTMDLTHILLFDHGRLKTARPQISKDTHHYLVGTIVRMVQETCKKDLNSAGRPLPITTKQTRMAMLMASCMVQTSGLLRATSQDFAKESCNTSTFPFTNIFR